MQSKFILAALAALAAGSVHAQGSTEIYGRINLSLERQDVGGTKSSGMYDNASRIGFRGTEDLGGGLKVGFVLEHGFNADTGSAAGTFWGRESTVSLAGSFGTVRLGNMPASEAYFATADYVSMHNHDTGSSSDALTSIPGATFGINNSISYYSPNMGGFNFAVQTAERVAGERPLVLAGNYDAGPLHLGLGYAKYGTDKSLGLRALYEMGAFTVGGYYEKGSGTNDVNVFRLAGMYAMGASEFHLNFGSRGDLNNIADTGAKQMTLGYNYNLSKRTKVYGFYTKLNADVGADFSSLALGVRHNF
jgi:predicted porin